MSMLPLELTIEVYRQYYDHFEAHNYGNEFVPGTRKTRRELNRRKFVVYHLKHGLPSCAVKRYCLFSDTEEADLVAEYFGMPRTIENKVI